MLVHILQYWLLASQESSLHSTLWCRTLLHLFHSVSSAVVSHLAFLFCFSCCPRISWHRLSSFCSSFPPTLYSCPLALRASLLLYPICLLDANIQRKSISHCFLHNGKLECVCVVVAFPQYFRSKMRITQNIWISHTSNTSLLSIVNWLRLHRNSFNSR